MDKIIKRICFITPRYPTESNPVHTFVDSLICEIADQGIECYVISPYSLTDRLIRKSEYLPKYRERITKNHNIIRIYTPRYISYSTRMFGINTSYITYKNFYKSALKTYMRLGINTDIMYGHFIYPSGICAADIGNRLGIPSLLAYGESSSANYLCVGKTKLICSLNSLSGIISVSSKNKKELIGLGIKNDIPIEVFPNAINRTKFFKIEKSIARKELGINDDRYIIMFVGHFIERKGVRILSSVIDELDDVYSFFIGDGPIEPICRNILYKGRVPHDKVHLYLNAADVFVLPTQAEGCCNAIVEAIACGLPIISSSKSFNDDILSEKNSIRIDVSDKQTLLDSIKLLKNDLELRNSMSNSSLEMSADLDIGVRAKRIIGFMKSIISEK